MNKIIEFLKQSNRYKHLIGGLLVGILAFTPWTALYAAAVAASCLELKDKLDLEDAFEQKLANQAAADTTETAGDSQLQEAVQALVALGYPNTDALRAVKKVEGAETMDVETLLKAALKKML